MRGFVEALPGQFALTRELAVRKTPCVFVQQRSHVVVAARVQGARCLTQELALGALGLDFAFATEHASNSDQVIEAEFRVTDTQHLYRYKHTLRDMSSARFDHLLERLDTTNRSVALRGGGTLPPQTDLSHGAFPRQFLGGELDAIPEAMFAELDNPRIQYGNELLYDVDRLMASLSALPDFARRELRV